jgi:hypothetical protein
MCQQHFQRWKKYGDPLVTKRRVAGASGTVYVLVLESSKPAEDFH